MDEQEGSGIRQSGQICRTWPDNRQPAKMQGMSQKKLAEKAKISRSHLSSIEAPNIVRPFSLEVLYNIADALGVRAGDLLNATLPPTK